MSLSNQFSQFQDLQDVYLGEKNPWLTFVLKYERYRAFHSDFSKYNIDTINSNSSLISLLIGHARQFPDLILNLWSSYYLRGIIKCNLTPERLMPYIKSSYERKHLPTLRFLAKQHHFNALTLEPVKALAKQAYEYLTTVKDSFIRYLAIHDSKFPNISEELSALKTDIFCRRLQSKVSVERIKKYEDELKLSYSAALSVTLKSIAQENSKNEELARKIKELSAKREELSKAVGSEQKFATEINECNTEIKRIEDERSKNVKLTYDKLNVFLPQHKVQLALEYRTNLVVFTQKVLCEQYESVRKSDDPFALLSFLRVSINSLISAFKYYNNMDKFNFDFKNLEDAISRLEKMDLYNCLPSIYAHLYLNLKMEIYCIMLRYTNPVQKEQCEELRNKFLMIYNKNESTKVSATSDQLMIVRSLESKNLVNDQFSNMAVYNEITYTLLSKSDLLLQRKVFLAKAYSLGLLKPPSAEVTQIDKAVQLLQEAINEGYAPARQALDEIRGEDPSLKLSEEKIPKIEVPLSNDGFYINPLKCSAMDLNAAFEPKGTFELLSKLFLDINYVNPKSKDDYVNIIECLGKLSIDKNLKNLIENKSYKEKLLNGTAEASAELKRLIEELLNVVKVRFDELLSKDASAATNYDPQEFNRVKAKLQQLTWYFANQASAERNRALVALLQEADACSIRQGSAVEEAYAQHIGLMQITDGLKHINMSQQNRRDLILQRMVPGVHQGHYYRNLIGKDVGVIPKQQALTSDPFVKSFLPYLQGKLWAMREFYKQFTVEASCDALMKYLDDASLAADSTNTKTSKNEKKNALKILNQVYSYVTTHLKLTDVLDTSKENVITFTMDGVRKILLQTGHLLQLPPPPPPTMNMFSATGSASAASVARPVVPAAMILMVNLQPENVPVAAAAAVRVAVAAPIVAAPVAVAAPIAVAVPPIAAAVRVAAAAPIVAAPAAVAAPIAGAVPIEDAPVVLMAPRRVAVAAPLLPIAPAPEPRDEGGRAAMRMG